MRAIPKILLGSVALLALAACDSGVGSSWTQEAGAFIDEGNFGNPTMNNILVQNGDRDFTIALQQRFANEVPDTINFEFNSAVLDADAQAILRQQADWIRQFPEVRFRVYGHTDLVGSNAYNQGLGLRRAQAAVAYLSSQGISRSRLEAVASFGETRPVVPTAEPERRNRRTVTEVTGFVARHPTVLDGKYAQIIYRDYVQSAQATSATEGGGLAAIEGGGG
jgi:outer membrane protein OmpA-like peptidoglycan-associated protein